MRDFCTGRSFGPAIGGAVRPAGLPRSWARAWLRDLLAFLDERGLSGLAWAAGDRPHLAQAPDGGDVRLPDRPPDPARPTELGALVRAWLRGA